MRYRIFLIILFAVSSLYSQNNKKIIGKISYISSQNVYVKFPATEGISVGDSLYRNVSGNFVPVIRVKYLSSISVSGEKITDRKLKVGNEIIAFVHHTIGQKQQKVIAEETVIEPKKQKETQNKKVSNFTKYSGYNKVDESSINGRFAVSTYANFSNINSTNFVRWRYTLSLNGSRVGNSNISFDSYISFNYRSTDWASVKNNIGRALKIYALSMKYNFSDNTSLTVGRKINKVITNISAVDGVQFESKIGQVNYGLIAGSRPNFSDYGLNAKLFEYGAYISNTTTAGYGNMQNSIAVFQQTNNFKTDRRFLYFQHNSHFVKNIGLFLSSEVDLYKRVNGTPQSTFSLTGLFTSIRYRASRFLSLSASYDNRKNVVYYETYKSYADSLLDSATRQGLRFRMNLRPINRLSLYFTYGYRFMDGDARKTKNYSAGFSYSRIPFIHGTISGTYNNLKTSYLDGRIFSGRYSKDIFGGSIYATLGYRNIKYKFLSGVNDLNQNIFSADLTWRALRKLNLNISYEGVFESTNSYGRVYFNFTKRF